MNILDFDNTIYNGDTARDIIKFSLIKHPLLTINSILKTIPKYIKYIKGKKTFEEVKSSLFSFLFKIDNLEKYINDFIDKNIHNIKNWYKNRNKEKDIIISASLEVWIKPFCNKIGVSKVIATKTDKNGYIKGLNCKGKEKVNRLLKEYPNIKINEAYSDSKVDIPMLEIARKPYVVKGESLIEYEKGYNFKIKR